MRFTFELFDEDEVLHKMIIENDRAGSAHFLISQCIIFLSHMNYCDEQIKDAIKSAYNRELNKEE